MALDDRADGGLQAVVVVRVLAEEHDDAAVFAVADGDEASTDGAFRAVGDADGATLLAQEAVDEGHGVALEDGAAPFVQGALEVVVADDLD